MKSIQLTALIATICGTLSAASMTWSSPQTVYSQESVDIQDAKIALHSTSSAAAIIWQAESGGIYTIQASKFDGTDWAAPTNLSSSDEAAKLNIGMDSSGNAVAVWDKYELGSLSIFSAHYDGTNWGDAASLEAMTTAYFAPLPTLSVNPSGNATISWIDENSRLKGATYLASTASWSSSYYISEPNLTISTDIPSPVCICPQNINTTIIFTPTSILTNETSATSPEEPPENTLLAPFQAGSAYPAFKIDYRSNHSAFIFQYTTNQFIIFASNFYGTSQENSWNYTVAGVPNPRLAVTDFDIAINPNNSGAAAIWKLSSGAIGVATFNGNSWKLATELSTNGSSPSIAINPTNQHVIAVWADLTAGGSNNTVKVSEFDGVSWSSPTAISSTSTTLDKAQIQINEQGYGLITWQRLVGSNTVVESANSSS